MSYRLEENRIKKVSDLNWKEAAGITESGKKGTNSMLAERDYTLKCQTTGTPMLVVNGVWIWYCDTHHQPLACCDRARFKARALEFAT